MVDTEQQIKLSDRLNAAIEQVKKTGQPFRFRVADADEQLAVVHTLIESFDGFGAHAHYEPVGDKLRETDQSGFQVVVYPER